MTVPPVTTSETGRRACAEPVTAAKATNARVRRLICAILSLPSCLSCPSRPSRPLYSAPVPVHIVDHPLVHDALITLRDKRTPPAAFRRAATRLSVLLAAEALQTVKTTDVTVDTPLGPAPGRMLGREVVVVPVLRA